MVSEVVLSRTNSDDEEYQVDTIRDSAISSTGNDLLDDGTLVLGEDQEQPEVPSFGNISVMNSNDIHFGNKTFYQGPVTIKQFLYANGKVRCDNESDLDLTKSEVILDATALPHGVDNSTFLADVLPNNKSCDNAIDKEVPNHQNQTGIFKSFQQVRKFSKRNICILGIVLAIIVISLLVLITVLLVRPQLEVRGTDTTLPRGDSDEQDITKPIDAPLDPSVNLTLPGKLKMVTRIEWLAQPPQEEANALSTPVPYVIISHTATENCSSQAQCVFHVRYIQMFHIESKHWWDIGYNFLVGGDGEAYEGRGWKAEGAHTYGYNSRSIGIAFIGTFNNYKPPERQITACKQLIAKGVQLGYISKNYKLLAARQLQTTQSPGAALYENMKSWDHWAKEP